MPVAVNAGSACCVQGASCSLYPILRHHRPPFTLMVCRVDPSSELTRVDGRLDYPLQGSGCGFDGQSALPPSAVALPGRRMAPVCRVPPPQRLASARMCCAHG